MLDQLINDIKTKFQNGKTQTQTRSLSRGGWPKKDSHGRKSGAQSASNHSHIGVGGVGDQDENFEDSSDLPINDEAPKKLSQKSLLIKVALVLGAGVLAFDFLKNDTDLISGIFPHESSLEVVNAPKPKRPKRKKIVAPVNNVESALPVTGDQTQIASSEIAPPPLGDEAKSDESLPAGAPIGAENIVSQGTTENTKPLSDLENAPIENISIAEKEVLPSPELSMDGKTGVEGEVVPPSPSMAEAKAEAIDQIEIVNKPNEVEEIKVGDTLKGAPLGKVSDHNTQYNPQKVDGISVEKPNSSRSVSSDSIVKPEAPLLENIGRGLVYNCKDKHWACVDKGTFLACHKNMLWNQSKQSANECVTKTVYASTEDCQKIQTYNVSTVANTSFCH